MTPKVRPSSKLLGDAGEHYALSQFSFAEKYAAKMPDNWEAYDLAVETGGLVRVSVKTRSESEGWKKVGGLALTIEKTAIGLSLFSNQKLALSVHGLYLIR